MFSHWAQVRIFGSSGIFFQESKQNVGNFFILCSFIFPFEAFSPFCYIQRKETRESEQNIPCSSYQHKKQIAQSFFFDCLKKNSDKIVNSITFGGTGWGFLHIFVECSSWFLFCRVQFIRNKCVLFLAEGATQTFSNSFWYQKISFYELALRAATRARSILSAVAGGTGANTLQTWSQSTSPAWTSENICSLISCWIFQHCNQGPFYGAVNLNLQCSAGRGWGRGRGREGWGGRYLQCGLCGTQLPGGVLVNFFLKGCAQKNALNEQRNFEKKNKKKHEECGLAMTMIIDSLSTKR